MLIKYVYIINSQKNAEGIISEFRESNIDLENYADYLVPK